VTTQASWRTPTVVLVCAAIILTLALGVRQTFGLFLQPMSAELGWGRGHFSFAFALSNLLWGLAQPVFGAWADKQGSGRVVAVSALLYAAGLALLPLSTTPLMLDFSAGLLIGLGISGVSFGVVLGVVGRAFPPERRSLALGIASAGGSFGQFLMVPFGAWLIGSIDWKYSLLVLAGVILATVPLAAAMVEERGRPLSPAAGDSKPQSLRMALREAGGHSGFWYLTAGFFVCGFQVAFISIHLPVYLRDLNLPLTVAGWALALIGLFNILGSFAAGFLGARFSKKYVLSSIYFLRAAVIGLFLLLPVSPLSVYLFAAGIGFLWLGTVPLTNGLVGQIFGVRYVSTLFGIVFLSHQVGSFLGVWLGSVVLSLLAGALNLPIDERPLARLSVEGGTA